MKKAISIGLMALLVVTHGICAADEILSAARTGVEDLVEFSFRIPKKQGHNVFGSATLVIEEGGQRVAFIPVAYAVDEKTAVCHGLFRISATLVAKCHLMLGGIVAKDPRIDTVWSKEIRLADINVE